MQLVLLRRLVECACCCDQASDSKPNQSSLLTQTTFPTQPNGEVKATTTQVCANGKMRLLLSRACNNTAPDPVPCRPSQGSHTKLFREPAATIDDDAKFDTVLMQRTMMRESGSVSLAVHGGATSQHFPVFLAEWHKNDRILKFVGLLFPVAES